jgi:hypothetical protein|tara:strand:+ start:4949 stop:5131 length:183 start_codon:yes stop_codon:yes gene_type:complete
MANKGLDTVRKVGGSVTPIVVGSLLINGTVALAVIGAQGNLILGWAMVAVGVLDLINSFR